jgi:O-antigen/teichoic acid export membrane protein
MSVARILIRNSSLLLTTNLAARFSSAMLFLLVARFRQPDIAGIYTLAMSYVLLLESGTQLGLDQLLIRDITRERSKTQIIFQQSLSLRFGTLVGVLSVVFLGMWWLHPYSVDVRLTIMVMLLVTLPDVFIDMCQALFTANNRLAWPTLISFGAGVFKIALGAVVIASGGTLLHLALVMLLTSLIQMLLYSYLALRQGVQLKLSFSIRQSRSLLAQAVPFGIIQLLLTIEAYLGSVILSASVPDAVLGYYGAANTVLSALILIPNAVQLSVFSRMTELFTLSRPRLDDFYLRIYRYLFILGGGLMIGMLALSDFIIVALFRNPFSSATILLQILLISLFINFINIPNVRIMVLLGKQHLMAEMLLVSVSLNVLLTLLLIPRLSVLAIPVSRVVSMTCFWGMNQLYVHRYIVEGRLRGLFLRLAVALLIGLSLMLLTYQLTFWLQLFISLTAYFAIILVLGGLPREERRFLWGVLSKRTSTYDS